MTARPLSTEGATDERNLLREALRDVIPIKSSDKVRHPPRLIEPIPVQRLRAEQEILAETLGDGSALEDGVESGAEVAFVRAGVSRQTLRKLRRGHWVAQGELDLHGLTVAAARESLALFLQQCLRDHWRCVRIIHGRGLRSKDGEPVLKSKTVRWLSQRDEVLAFCQARPADGGAGAVVVLLRGR